MSLETVVYTLLQDERRGWRIDLFTDKNIQMEYKCYYCGNVCKDAVELSCDVDHDYASIQLYCERCLKQIITSNNNYCPINKHLSPTYISAKRVRWKINKAKVLCPNSMEYKQQQSNDKNVANGNVFDTCDEKEGMERCNFRGNLSELIAHISKCCQSNLRSNELQTYIIKELRNDINKLNNKNKHLQNALASQNYIIDALKKQIHSLIQKCNENKQSQNDLKKQNEQQKHRISILENSIANKTQNDQNKSEKIGNKKKEKYMREREKYFRKCYLLL